MGIQPIQSPNLNTYDSLPDILSFFHLSRNIRLWHQNQFLLSMPHLDQGLPPLFWIQKWSQTSTSSTGTRLSPPYLSFAFIMSSVLTGQRPRCWQRKLTYHIGKQYAKQVRKWTFVSPRVGLNCDLIGYQLCELRNMTFPMTQSLHS